ncbi:MAG TPA: PH domain-containing protein [Longimicrobiales bacterium]
MTTVSSTGGAHLRPPATDAQPFPELPTTLAPDRGLLAYYALSSLVLGPAFVFALIPLYFRYHTLRYDVDGEGITMRWGILFRREISLTYARIQDIHLSSNFVERWLGLAKIQLQTASGSASAEMTIEGLRRFEAIRDFLYSRMRGAHDPKASVSAEPDGALSPDALRELTATLRDVAAEVRALREALAGVATPRPPEGVARGDGGGAPSGEGRRPEGDAEHGDA